MARYNESIMVTFNDNDGGVGFSINPATSSDFARYQRIFGKWRTRWIVFKRFWIAMRRMEDHCADYQHDGPIKLWVFKAEIPE